MSRETSREQLLEERVGALLKARSMSLAVAESCTGGLILHRLTNIAGSSDYVLGGFVTYSNEAKYKFAHVRKTTLRQYGAVSEQTAVEMARGTRTAFGADVALSVTGIAGPGGGTSAKPVGLTYIGFSAQNVERAERFVWPHDREGNKRASADAALQILFDYLTGKHETLVNTRTPRQIRPTP
jgi:nicotinamide-nucleotide amidase